MHAASIRASSVRTFLFHARSTHERFAVHQHPHLAPEGGHHLHRGCSRNEDIPLFVTRTRARLRLAVTLTGMTDTMRIMQTTPTATAALDRFSSPEQAFEAKPAVVFFTMADGTFHEVGGFEDSFEALHTIANIPMLPKATGIGIYTTGKASKLDEGGEHDDTAEKIRCEVVVVCDRSFMMSSAIRMQGTEAHIEAGAGDGRLADAICVAAMISMRKGSALEHHAD
jgi:hypothetical protein